MKRVIINNCNLAEKDHLAKFTKGLMKSDKVEYIDFMLCDLNDKHEMFICMLIKE